MEAVHLEANKMSENFTYDEKKGLLFINLNVYRIRKISTPKNHVQQLAKMFQISCFFPPPSFSGCHK